MTVLHIGLPVTRLLVNVKGQTGRASKGEKTLYGASNDVPTVLICRQPEVLTGWTALAELNVIAVLTVRLTFNY